MNPSVASAHDIARPSGAAALDGIITQQASMIAYMDVLIPDAPSVSSK
jgi:hypothetical protein